MKFQWDVRQQSKNIFKNHTPGVRFDPATRNEG